MITEIKKGDRFRCVKDYSESDTIFFKEGKVYDSFCDLKIRNEKYGHHSMTFDVVNKYFEKIEPSTGSAIAEIKKGDRFRCIQNYLTEDGQSYCYFNGREYLSERGGSITDIQKNKYHEWSLQNVNEYFQLITDTDVAQDLTREAIEQDEVEKSTTAQINNKNMETTKEKTEKSTATFQSITASLGELLAYKNQLYGNSALEPINVFAGKSKVGQRLDDKISRVRNSAELRKNDIADMMGYLILICQENNWTNFDEFKD